MKLTKTLRQAITRAIMQDVPSVDYNAQAAALVRKAVGAWASPKVRAALADDAIAQHFDFSHFSLPGLLNSVSVRGVLTHAQRNAILATIREELDPLAALNKAQISQREDMREKIAAALNSVTTTQAVIKAFPEFTKYMPRDPSPESRGQLIAPSPVDALTAAGWKP